MGRNKTVIFTFGFARGMNRDDHTKKSLYHLSEICTWHFSAAILSQQKTGSFFMQQLFSLSLSPVFLFVFSVTAANPLFPSGACLWRCVQHYFSPSTGQLHFLLRALQKQSVLLADTVDLLDLVYFVTFSFNGASVLGEQTTC